MAASVRPAAARGQGRRSRPGTSPDPEPDRSCVPSVGIGREIRARRGPGSTPCGFGTCVAGEDATRAPAWRLRAPDLVVGFDDLALGRQSQNLRDAVGDFVIRRVEGWYAYQLAVVVDDAAQGITEIVRGADLLDSTPRQIHLQRLLRLPTPAYLHQPLVLDAEGRKLSKQDRARPIDRDNPVPALRAALEFLGMDPRGVAANVQALLDAALRQFDPLRLPKSVAAPAEFGRQ